MKAIFQWVGLFLWFLPWNLQGLNFTIHDIETLRFDGSHAKSINNQNMIVGSFKQANVVTNFMWEKEKGLTLLPFTSSYQFPLINNHDQVAGIFWHCTNYWFALNTRFKQFYIFNADGSYQNIEAPKQWNIQKLQDWQQNPSWDEKELAILAFNDQQQMLIANSNDADKVSKFAVWQEGVFKEIDSSVLVTAYSMNNQGLILGRKWIKTESGQIPMLVLYDLNQGTTIEIMKDINLTYRALNDKGQVIAVQATKDLKFLKGFLWDSQQGLKSLDDFAPLALNNCNQMMGFQISEAQKKNFVWLFWNNGEVINISQMIGIDQEDSFWSEISLEEMNDNGYIIGHGKFDGKGHAFVLVPSSD